MLELVTAVRKGYWAGRDYFFELRKAGSDEDDKEIVTAQMDSKFASAVVAEIVKLSSENLYGRSGNKRTEVFVQVVYVLYVDESN